MRKKVLVVTAIHNVLTDFLSAEGYECVVDYDIAYESVLKQADRYEGIITSNKLPIDRTLLDAATRLRWVGRMGSGMEIIDIPYAEAKEIKCFSSPEGNANAVAEQALGMLLTLQHHIFRAANEVRAGIWRRDENRGVEIEGLSAGIIGYGNNGRAFARKLLALNVHVYAYDKYTRIAKEDENLFICDNMDAIYKQCDIISFHVPLNEETRHYFSFDFLNRMVKPFVLLNLSRGGVVDTLALHQGLRSGRISGAALDVWEKEPIHQMPDKIRQAADEMLKMDNFIGTPHIGGYSTQATYKMSYFLMEKIKTYLRHF